MEIMKLVKILLISVMLAIVVTPFVLYRVAIADHVAGEIRLVLNKFSEWHVLAWCVGMSCVGCLLLMCYGLFSMWTVYYLHWRTPRNRGSGRRTWFDEHRDVLDDPDMAELSKIVTCPADGLNAHPGRKVANVCGGSVRRAMGFPDRTKANIVLASQRCEAWLREHCPNLRNSDWQVVHARSVVVALTASRAEEEMGRAIFSPQASRAQLVAHTPHFIPRYEGPLGRFLSYFGVEEPSVQNFQ